MQKLSQQHGLPLTTRALRFLSIRLGSQPDTAPLAAAVDAVRENIRDANEKWEFAVEMRIAASAELEWADGQLDKEIIALGYEVRSLVAGDVKDARYRKLFSVAPSQGMKSSGGANQKRFVQNIIERLQSDSDLAEVKPRAAALEEKLGLLDAKIAARNELYVPEMRAQADRRIALESARQSYNAMYPQLILMLGEDLAESFFRKLQKSGPKDES